MGLSGYFTQDLEDPPPPPLPDLVVPIDREWTGRVFRLHNPEWEDLGNQRRTFRRIYGHFVDVARQVHPQQYVTGQGWRRQARGVVQVALLQTGAGRWAPTASAWSGAGLRSPPCGHVGRPPRPVTAGRAHPPFYA